MKSVPFAEIGDKQFFVAEHENGPAVFLKYGNQGQQIRKLKPLLDRTVTRWTLDFEGDSKPFGPADIVYPLDWRTY